jgi:hypothetical protein
VDVAGEDVDDPRAAKDEVGGLETAGDADGAAQGLAAGGALVAVEGRGNLRVRGCLPLSARAARGVKKRPALGLGGAFRAS